MSRACSTTSYQAASDSRLDLRRIATTITLRAADSCLLGVILAVGLERRLGQGDDADDPSTLRENRGKQIYVQGTSPSGKENLAYIGESSLEVPGSAMACANCHGLDGQGKPEGGVNPSNLTWEALTKPYGRHARQTDETHPPYTERGLESGDHPRHRSAGQQAAERDASLPDVQRGPGRSHRVSERLGSDRDPGISENTIVIGTAVPTKARWLRWARRSKPSPSAFFDELNSQGGIYNRRFELKFVETAETPAARAPTSSAC